MLSIIVAVGKNNVIGLNNSLLWHLPDDLKRFKKITSGHTIIMGRKTFESLPKLLPNRHHVVMTRDASFKYEDANVKVIHDLSGLDKFIKDEEEHFVIGGGEIYKLLLPYCNKIYLTKVLKAFDGDTFFPVINDEDWKIISSEQGKIDEKNAIPHVFIEMIKK